jgi:hypothetical protein
MGLHICAVVPFTTDGRGEYVEIVNSGSTPVGLTGLKLTDYTATQQHVHVFTFPATKGGRELVLAPGKTAYVFTGRGVNRRNDNGNLLLFANRRAAIWNNSGDVAYLRNPDGTFIDTMTVGAPKRHPNGHVRLRRAS